MSSADQSSFFDPLPLAKFSADADDDKALHIEGHDDLFTLRSFLGGDDDEASLLDSFNVEESFFDVPEDVIADLETIPEIDESAMSSAPMSDLTHAVKRLSMDCTSTFVASQTSSSCSSPSTSTSQGSFQVSESFAQCMRNSSQSREQLNLWQEQIRQNSSASTSSTNTSASSERKRSHSTIEQSTTTPTTTASPNGSSNSSVEAILPFPKRQARPETVICTAQFLCGSRPTLTAALEQSRKALKEYMLRAKCA